MGRPITCACGVCKKCRHREYMRAYKRAHPQKTYDRERRRAYDRERWANDPVYRKRHSARMSLAQQVRRGQQVKGPCALCGEAKTIGHHNDYNQPLEATWLCIPCHTLIHSALPTW